MYTNARSLSPKTDSLVTMFDELELGFASITETWFSDGEIFEKNAKKLEDEDLRIVQKSRKSRGGGVAIVFNVRKINLSNVWIKDNKFELVSVVGRTVESSTKILILTAYYPPQMNKEKLDGMNDCISAHLDEMKEKIGGLKL